MIVAPESTDPASDEARELPAQGNHGHAHGDEPAPSLSWTQRRIHGAILWYQRLREGRPSPCRFSPSCSSYALEAFDTHGTWRGGWLTLRRLGRCRPLGPSGYDPVPLPADSSRSPAATQSTRSSQSTRSKRKGG